MQIHMKGQENYKKVKKQKKHSAYKEKHSISPYESDSRKYWKYHSNYSARKPYLMIVVNKSMITGRLEKI